MRIGIFPIEIMGIVGGNQGESHFIRQINRPVSTQFLHFQARVLDFHVETVAEDFDVPLEEIPGFSHFLTENQMRQLTRYTTRQADQAVTVRFEQFLIDARFIVETIQICGGGHLHQILKPSAVHRQQCEMIAGLFHRGRFFVGAATRGNVGFVSKHGVDPVSFAGGVKLDRPVQVAVIGDRQRIRSAVFDLLNQVGNAVGSVEQAEMGVAMQMDKWHRVAHGNPSLLGVGPSPLNGGDYTAHG